MPCTLQLMDPKFSSLHTSSRCMLDGRLLRFNSDMILMTASISGSWTISNRWSGDPRSSVTRTVNLWWRETCVAVKYFRCWHVQMGDLYPTTPKRGAREQGRKKNVRISSQGALRQEIGIGRQWAPSRTFSKRSRLYHQWNPGLFSPWDRQAPWAAASRHEADRRRCSAFFNHVQARTSSQRMHSQWLEAGVVLRSSICNSCAIELRATLLDGP